MRSLFDKIWNGMFLSNIPSPVQFLYEQNHKLEIKNKNKCKRPPNGGLKNTNDEKNLFRKIQTEYVRIIQHTLFYYISSREKYKIRPELENEYFQ